MKTFFTTIMLLFTVSQMYAQRYLEEVFDSAVVVSDVLYSQNITVITDPPSLDSLYADYYMPFGDTETNRPFIIYLHTGSFLPAGPPTFANGQPTGSKSDYAVVESCKRLAKMGYVVAAIEYRQGWNPLASTVEIRRNQLINAAYRSLQDTRAFIRFNWLLWQDGGNPYGISPCKISAFGQGTGGYISFVCATLDSQEEVNIPKFQDPIDGTPYINTAIVGDIYGEMQAAINVPNHVGWPSDIQFAFNAGGALGDSSWIDTNSIPMASAHVVNDPFAPFGIDPNTGLTDCEGLVVVPTNNDPVVDVAGSKCVIERANALGINDIFDDPLIHNDPIDQAVLGQMYAEPNLWAIHRPSPESAPWEFWDAAFWSTIPNLLVDPTGNTSFHDVASLTNPDMSIDKADRYIDTLIALFAPRSYLALDLENIQGFACTPVSVEELIDANSIGLTLAPNPAGQYVNFQAEKEQILDLELYDISGRLMQRIQSINSNNYQLNRNNIPPGIYIAKVRFEEGIIAEKLIFK